MIKEEWYEYYLYLEELRQSGETNMFGASPYLQAEYGLNPKEARRVLGNWIENYDELVKRKIIVRN